MESANNKEPQIKIPDPVEAVRKKYDDLLTVIIVVLFIGFVTLILTVFAIVIDVWNTKTVFYQEYTKQNSLVENQREILKKLEELKVPIESPPSPNPTPPTIPEK